MGPTCAGGAVLALLFIGALIVLSIVGFDE